MSQLELNLQKGLVGHWTMDDGDTSGGTLYDSSAYDNHANLSSSIVTGVSGRVGEAYTFDGTSASKLPTKLSYNTTNLTKVSVSTWYKSTDTADHILVSSDRNEYWRLGVGSDSVDGVQWTVSSSDMVSSAPRSFLQDGNWHHIVGVFDGSLSNDHKIYIDASLDSEANLRSSVGSGDVSYTHIGVGSEASSFDGGTAPNDWMDGELDDVRVYNRALSESEVRALYNMRSQRQQTSDLQKGLTGHWTFNTVDTDSSILRDSSANDNHAEHRNGPTTDQSSIIGQSYSFDGVDNYLAVQNISFSSKNIGEFCVSAWVNIPTDGGDWSILDYDRSEYFTAAAGVRDGNASGEGDYVAFHTSGGGGGDMWSNAKVRDGTWHHVVWQQNEANSRKEIWIDRQLDSTQGCSGIGTGATRFGFIGGGSEAGSFDGDRNDNYYSGRISDLRFYSRALPQGEISRLYEKRE